MDGVSGGNDSLFERGLGALLFHYLSLGVLGPFAVRLGLLFGLCLVCLGCVVRFDLLLLLLLLAGIPVCHRCAIATRSFTGLPPSLRLAFFSLFFVGITLLPGTTFGVGWLFGGLALRLGAVALGVGGLGGGDEWLTASQRFVAPLASLRDPEAVARGDRTRHMTRAKLPLF